MRNRNPSLLETLESRVLCSASAVVANAVSFGASGDDRITAIATDSAGNIYATGFFQSTITIGNTPLTSAGNDDIFVCKISANGVVAWAFNIGSAGGEEPSHLLVDPSGNVYISAYFSGNFDVDPGAGTTMLAVSAPFDADSFIARYDTDGNFEWASKVSGSSFDTPGKILRDPNSGDILWNGIFTGTASFSSGLVTTQLTAVSNFGDPFLARFTAASGTITNITQNMRADAIDAQGNIFTAWNLSAPTDIDPGANTVTVTPTNSYAISFAKYDSNLNLLWHKDINGVYAAVYDLALDTNGAIIAGGDFAQSFRFDPAGKTGLLKEPASPDSFSGFLMKLDANGKFVWANALKGTGNNSNYSGWSDVWAVKVDAMSNIYVGGDFNGRINFGRPLAPRYLTSAANDDAFIASYSASGNLKWIKSIGGTTYDRITTFDFSVTGNIIAGGYISGTVGSLTTDGSNDAFFAAITPPRTNQLPIGRFDVISADWITGIALDPSDGSAPLTVKIYVDGVLVDTQTANIDRPDLITPQNFPPITTAHGFSFSPAVPLSGWHTIKVFALDTTTNAPRLIANRRVHI